MMYVTFVAAGKEGGFLCGSVCGWGQDRPRVDTVSVDEPGLRRQGEVRRG